MQKFGNIQTQQQDSTFNSLIRADTGLFNLKTGNSIDQDTSESVNFFNAKDQSILTTELNDSNETVITSNYNKNNYNTYNRIIEKDTTIQLFNVDTIPYLLENTVENKLIQENFLLNLKSIKPQEKNKVVKQKVEIVKKQKIEKPIQQISEETTTTKASDNNLKIFKKDFQYNSNTNWEIGVIIISVLIIGWTRLFFRNIISNYVNAALSYQTSLNLFIDSNILTKRVSVLLDVLFYINISFFLFKLLEYYSIGVFELNGFSVFIICLAFALSIYFTKWLIHKSLGSIFLISKSVSEYLFQIFLFNKMMGIILLPFVISYSFIPIEVQPTILKIFLILIILIYIIRIFRGLIISINNKLSIFYIILYLCTLEFLPILIFYKLYACYLTC